MPGQDLVGGENDGWALITNQLNHERVTLCSPGIDRAPPRPTCASWAQETKLADGRRVIDQEWVQLNLARVHAKLEFLRLINWKVAWTATTGQLDVADASTIKVFGTEFYLEAFRLLMEVIGPRAYLKADAPESMLRARLEMRHPRLDHPHLRRWNQRDAARPHRDVRPRLPPLVPLTSFETTREATMDFSFTPEQEELRALARRVFADRCTPEHLKKVAFDLGESGVDLELWREIAELGLVGVALPESAGGGGMGFFEVAIVLEEVGHAVAPIPPFP